MNQINDGGRAFPITGTHEDVLEAGMSLRDYFAAKAMPAVYQRVESGGFARVAELSYEMADAMLKAREVKP